MKFDMTKFCQRAKLYIDRSKASTVTVSKKLFGNNANTLAGVFDGSVSPRFDTLVKAEKHLTKLEAELERTQ